MSVKIENLEKNIVKLTIEVPAEELEEAIQEAYLSQRGQISMPGFRKGKAPRKMIEKMYGAGIFYEEAANELIASEYAKAADESDLDIVSQPEIAVVELESGKPFVFTATVAIKPEVTLGEYKGVEIPKADLEVSEEDVAAELKVEQEKNSRLVAVEDRPVEDGDTVRLDFEGFVDEVAFEGGKGEDYPLAIGSNSFIPGFEEQLIGAKIGEALDVNVTFPEEYQAPELAGKPAVFKCTVNKIETKELPELDDEFAKDVSEFDTLEEYKADVKVNLAKKKEEAAKNAKEDAVVDKVIENAEMDIPDAMLETQTGQLLDDFSRRIQAQGLDMEQYMQITGSNIDALREQMRPQAVKRIQSRLVLEKIAEVENIEVSEERIDEEIAKMAEMYKMEADKLKELMGDYEKEQMKKDMAVQDAVTLIADAAKEVQKSRVLNENEQQRSLSLVRRLFEGT